MLSSIHFCRKEPAYTRISTMPTNISPKPERIMCRVDLYLFNTYYSSIAISFHHFVSVNTRDFKEKNKSIFYYSKFSQVFNILLFFPIFLRLNWLGRFLHQFLAMLGKKNIFVFYETYNLFSSHFYPCQKFQISFH